VLAEWQHRLTELVAEHDVPGASLAVLAGGQVNALAAGVLHGGTGELTRSGRTPAGPPEGAVRPGTAVS
jgi:hypothetical protein